MIQLGGLARPANWVLNHRFAAIWFLGTLSVCVQLLTAGAPGDWNYFEEFAHTSAREPSGFLSFYADNPGTWIGPLNLLAASPLTLLPTTAASWVMALLIVAALPLCLWLLERTARELGIADERRLHVLSLTGGLPAIACWQELSVSFIHPEDAMVGVLGCGALLSIVRRRPWVAALLLGLAASGKPWAVGLVPVVLAVGGGGRRRWAALLFAAVVAVAPWAPFVLGDPHTVQALRAASNTVAAGSPLGQLGYADGPFPWFTRPLQFATVFAVTTATALARRVDLLLIAGVGARLMSEPQTWSYYWATLVVGALAADLLSRRAAPVWTISVVTVGYELPRLLQLHAVPSAVLQATPVAVVLLLLSIQAVRSVRRGRLRPPPGSFPVRPRPRGSDPDRSAARRGAVVSRR